MARPVPASAPTPTTAQEGSRHPSKRSRQTKTSAASSTVVHACDPHRIVERRQEKADDGGIDAGKRGLRLAPLPQPLPERQGAEQHQERRRIEGA